MMATSPEDVDRTLKFGDGIFFHLSGRGMLKVWGRGEVHTGFWWRHLWGRFHFEKLGIHGRIILKLNF
jgi:hypothetical protein